MWGDADFCILRYTVQRGSVKAVQNRTAPCPHRREYLIVKTLRPDRGFIFVNIFAVRFGADCAS